MVDFELWDGTQGQACVTGRDDGIGLALLTPLLKPRTYDFVGFSDEAPTLGDLLLLIQHTKLTPVLDQRLSTVVGYMPSDLAFDFFLMRSDSAAVEGAVIVSRYDQIQGIRMPSLWLLEREIGVSGEMWALDAPKMASIALPLLRSGYVHMQIGSWYPFGLPDRVPPLPVAFHGEIVTDGAPAPMGSIIYARVNKEGLPGYWTSGRIREVGRYLFNVGFPPGDDDYDGGTVEFWMDCRRASTTATLEGPAGNVIELDLAF